VSLVRYSLFDIPCSISIIRYSLFDIHYSFFSLTYAQDAKLRVDGDLTKSYIEWMYTLNPAICDLINEKKVLLGVKFDPDDVEGCVVRLVKAKAALGDSDILVLFVTSTQHQKPRTQHKKSFGSRRFW